MATKSDLETAFAAMQNAHTAFAMLLIEDTSSYTAENRAFICGQVDAVAGVLTYIGEALKGLE